MFARPQHWYSMAKSKTATAMPTVYSPHPNKRKNSNAALTQDRSNSSVPMPDIWVKNSAIAPKTVRYSHARYSP